MTNKLTILLSFVALALATLYPFTKRYTHWPQFFLGLAFAIAIPMAFAAQTNAVPPLAWLLFAAAVIWSLAYDTLYAIADREFDIKMGMKSTAILFGKRDTQFVFLFHMLMLSMMVVAGLMTNRGVFYFCSIFIALFFAIHENKLGQTQEPAKCTEAFLNNHYLGLTIFIGTVLDFLIFPGQHL